MTRRETHAEIAFRLRLETDVRQLARLRGRMRPGAGFALLLFDLGEGGSMAYASSAERADMIRALRELIGELERAAGDTAPAGKDGHEADA